MKEKAGNCSSWPLASLKNTSMNSYRLAFWRVAAEEINYRRFFDVTELAAVRMEDPEVFADTHRLLLRLHSGEWIVDDAARLFEQRAHLPSLAAHQEAVRGTYDPTYGGYFLGRLAALKLRGDYAASRGPAFDLKLFHERVMTNGIAPWWGHRELLMPGDMRAVVE